MKTVLVVDDEFLVADLISAGLDDAGFRVVRAHNGRHALEVLEAEKPDLIITDFMMPRMNGLEFARAVREHPEYRDRPIILVSGAQGGVARIHSELFTDIYDKPFNVFELIERAAKILSTGADQ